MKWKSKSIFKITEVKAQESLSLDKLHESLLITFSSTNLYWWDNCLWINPQHLSTLLWYLLYKAGIVTDKMVPVHTIKPLSFETANLVLKSKNNKQIKWGKLLTDINKSAEGNIATNGREKPQTNHHLLHRETQSRLVCC